jgi:hypothetical protein
LLTKAVEDAGKGARRFLVITFACAVILAVASLALIGCSLGSTDNIWWPARP